MVFKIAVTSTGPSSGKTSLAKEIEKTYGFMRVDHSLTIAEDFIWYYNRHIRKWGEDELTINKLHANKEYWRPYLQEYSLREGVSSPELAGHWTDQTLIPWYRTHQTKHVVFEPFRGEIQAEEMRKRGFLLVQLRISEDVRMQRLGKTYYDAVKSMRQHPELECGINKPDIELDGSMPVGKLARIAVRLAQERQTAA